ncbi:MAG: adenine phosphoribosyltransferase [Candidatus Krumholzibacteria bacterium]|nr:adenine phosphoribosyltransferase [Candidatus Krumholzibacteria bacterium]
MNEELKKWIRSVPDFPRNGILFRDITPALLDPRIFGQICDILYERYEGKDIDKIAGIESRGFIFASTLAYRLHRGLIPLRKQGKLPWKKITEKYDLEYGEAALEMHIDSISPGERVLIIDDLLATGGTAAAAANLVKRQGGSVVEIAFILELEYLLGRDKIEDIPVFSLLSF